MGKRPMETNTHTILDRVSIAAPCNADWDKMIGDERERFCNQCSLNVYNISSMSNAEAEEFLSLRTEGRLCVQYYKRKDGTIITDNCPTGLKSIRNKSRKLLKAASAFLALLSTSNLFSWAQQGNDQSLPMATRGKILVRPNSEVKSETNPASKPDSKEPQMIPVGGAVYIAPQNDLTSCYIDAEKRLKDKLAKLESAQNDKLAIARAHLDLASFYRSKNNMQKAEQEYFIAVKMLSKMPKEKDLYKNSILNRITVLKLLDKHDAAANLEKTLLKIK